MTSSHPSATMFSQFLAEEHGLYRARPTSFLLAFLTQAVGVVVLIAIAAYLANHPPEIGRRVGAMIEGPISFPFILRRKSLAGTGAAARMTSSRLPVEPCL